LHTFGIDCLLVQIAQRVKHARYALVIQANSRHLRHLGIRAVATGLYDDLHAKIEAQLLRVSRVQIVHNVVEYGRMESGNPSQV
jgi:hypothetical protein